MVIFMCKKGEFGEILPGLGR